MGRVCGFTEILSKVCGVFGIVARNARIAEGLLERGTRSLVHRGPDDSGTIVLRDTVLGPLEIGLDAHHHVHTIPELLPVLMALHTRYRIDKVRMSRNMYDEIELPSGALLAKKRLHSFALRTIGFRKARFFTDLVTYIKLCGAHPQRAGSLELMRHPGSEPGSEEAKLLESGWTSPFSYDATLISYRIL